MKFKLVESYCVIQHTLTRPSTRMDLEVWLYKFYGAVLYCTSPVVQNSILIFNTLFSRAWDVASVLTPSVNNIVLY